LTLQQSCFLFGFFNAPCLRRADDHAKSFVAESTLENVCWFTSGSASKTKSVCSVVPKKCLIFVTWALERGYLWGGKSDFCHLIEASSFLVLNVTVDVSRNPHDLRIHFNKKFTKP
jgi:hypothetical protein